MEESRTESEKVADVNETNLVEAAGSIDSGSSEKKIPSKKKNPLLRFFVSIVTIVLTLAVLLAAALAFSAFDRRSSLASIPRNYSIYLRTDSAFATVNPLFDLQAADVFLSAPELSSVRKVFMDFRASPLRDNEALQFLASRPVDFALYGSGSKLGEDSHFVAIVNLGMFSLFSRVASYMYPKMNLSIDNLSYESNEQTSYYVYEIPGAMRLFVKSVKNLVIVSDSFEHLLTASLVQNDTSYTKEQLSLFKGSRPGELRIIADAHSLLHFVTEGNPVLSSIASFVSADSLSVISFNITDSDVALTCRLPMNIEEGENAALSQILSKKSTTPSLLTRFSDITQYYTVLNAGTLEELKDAVLPYLPDVKNPDEFWENCNGWCKTIFSMGLEELLFSWSGSEYAMLGIENQNDPVFAIQIKDEKARQQVFNNFTSSILIKNDNSLILGGVRLPRLELPAFLNFMLGALGINLPSPYFMVLDGVIYFSESPECLSSVYTNAHSGKALIKSKNYAEVSKDLKNESALSLFYNLERSVPFFLRSNETFSQVLQLYTMGRFDVRVDKSVLEFSLHACARKSGSLYAVPGFPIPLEGKTDALNLQVDSGKNPKNVYLVEDGKTLKSLNVSSMTVSSKAGSDKIEIVAAGKIKDDASLWTVTSHGLVDLLSPSLDSVSKFPIVLGETIACRPCSVGENLVLVTERSSVVIVKADASVSVIEIPGLSAKSEPVALPDGKSFVVYSKGFLGKIYYFEGEKCMNLDSPFEIPGIALGSPALLKSGGKTYIGFVTQAGEMNVWRADSSDGSQIDGFPMRIGGVFMTNVVASDKYFYALSNDALLYRISLDGSLLTVQIPQATARQGFLSVRAPEHNDRQNVYVCADANVIYGFNESLELLSGFPLTGWGKPVFADVNGDKVSECIALTVDKKLVAWKLR